MASNLACVGLAVNDHAGLTDLVGRIWPALVSLGRDGDVEVLRWQDPSGARLILEMAGGEVIGFLPSFAGTAGANLEDAHRANDEVWTVGIFDDEGSQLTAAAVELEQRRLLSPTDGLGGRASIVALGSAVGLHADEAAFAASDDSLLLSREAEPSEPPAHYVENGWSWPPRMAAEAFFAYGVFGEPHAAQAGARLAAMVLAARRHVVELTGQSFIVARARTCGFEIDICLGPEHTVVPQPGQIVAGEVLLTASLDEPGA